MPRQSVTKTILFSQISQGTKVTRWPVAAFVNEKEAKNYGLLIHNAHQTKNVELAVQLDPKTMLDDKRALIPGVKFSVVTVPYSPSLASVGDDIFGEITPVKQ